MTSGALEQVVSTLDARLPTSVERDASIASLTTYRLGGRVAALVRARDEPALSVLADVLRDHPVPLLVLGRGSNLLVADRGFGGVALLLEGTFGSLELGEHDVRSGAAVALPVLARRAAAAGRSGTEFLVGIPGTVGGAVRMNAGGHGRETADVLTRAWVADLASDGTPRPRTTEQLDLGYRHSALGPFEVVTAAELAVSPDDPAACEARIDEIVAWRRANQPGGANAGSVFRNPPGDSAGRLIDVAGLKGLRHGGATVSRKHANFVQAEPGASAADVRALVIEVQRRVAAATGVHLETELRMVGFPNGGEEP